MRLKTTICIHEDRQDCLVGVKLAILSIKKYHPDLPILVSTPSATDSFRSWVVRCPGVSELSYADDELAGFNVKPGILMRALDGGYQNAIWIDSDVIVCGDILPSIFNQADDVLVAAEETYFGQNQGGTIRTEAWGLSVGRALPSTINTGVLRITPKHRVLLEAWNTMLHHPLYARLQLMPWDERPLHMIGDQEVLTGLLGSVAFANIPIKFLKRGSEIAQCMGPAGFTPTERIKSFLSETPALIHSMGTKPWLRGNAPEISLNLQSLRRFYEFLHAELGPYSTVAREYRHLLGEDSDWMELSSGTAKILSTVFRNNISLKELPLSIFDSLVRHTRRALRIARYSVPEEYKLKDSPIAL
jgi:hypothetical protein